MRVESERRKNRKNNLMMRQTKKAQNNNRPHHASNDTNHIQVFSRDKYHKHFVSSVQNRGKYNKATREKERRSERKSIFQTINMKNETNTIRMVLLLCVLPLYVPYSEQQKLNEHEKNNSALN